MLKIDNNLLNEIGLSDLPDEEKKKLLLQIYETLEMRVGTRLSEQMEPSQLEEFSQFIENDQFAQSYLDSKYEGFENTEDYKTFVMQNQTEEEGSVISQYAALKWLETNFPDYQKVVKEELEKIKEEVKKDADKIKEIAKES